MVINNDNNQEKKKKRKPVFIIHIYKITNSIISLISASISLKIFLTVPMFSGVMFF